MAKTINKNTRAEFCYGIHYYCSPLRAIVFSSSAKMSEEYQQEKLKKTISIITSIDPLCKENVHHTK